MAKNVGDVFLDTLYIDETTNSAINNTDDKI